MIKCGIIGAVWKKRSLKQKWQRFWLGTEQNVMKIC